MTRSTSRLFGKIIFYLASFNTIFLAVFFVSRWTPARDHLSDMSAEIVFVTVLLAAAWALAMAGFISERRQAAALLWNFVLCSWIFLALVLEVFFHFNPRLIPRVFVNHNPALVYSSKEKSRMLELLEEGPWIKFKPDTEIASKGDRGADFVNRWKTDALGFKNEALPKEGLLAIAIGDSFTEGMGVSVRDTWTSQLTREGYAVYNMGVQGYAPIQTVQCLQKYGPKFKAPYILVGYTPGFEKRELHFLNVQGRPDSFTGGIESIRDYLQETRALHSVFKFNNTLIDTVKASLKQAALFFRDRLGKQKASRSTFHRYREAVENAAKTRYDSDAVEIRSTKTALLKAKKTAQELAAKPVIVLFASRNMVYYEKVMGAPPPAGHFELKLREDLRRFCAENGIELVDTAPTLQNYVNNLQDTAAAEKLPYFMIDGHHNRIGNTLVAQAVLDFFQKGRLKNDT